MEPTCEEYCSLKLLQCISYYRSVFWRSFLLLLICVGTAIILFLSSVDLWGPRVGDWLATPTYVEQADAVVVHGGNDDRTHYGFTLYHGGFAPEYWHTSFPYKKQFVVDTVVRHGIPLHALRVLDSHSTWDDGTQIAELSRLQDVQSILVVTDWWHSRRALCATQQQLGNSSVTIFYTALPDQAYGPDNWWRYTEGRSHVAQELIKFGYYWLRYGMNPWQC